MQKELLEIEFRYNDRPIGSRPATSCSKTIAIGIFDTLEEAVKAGNETLKVLSEHFQVRADDRFKVRGLFGTDSVHQKDGYTLIYNSTIGGVYMLYREANDAEIEWYNNN